MKNTGDHNSVTCETILLDPKRDINKLSIGDLDGDGYPDWEYGQVSLTSGPTRIMGRHIASLVRVSIADGRVDDVLKNARELIEGAVPGPDRAVYFSHADMVKTYTGGVIETIAGRRAGEASDLSADCLRHPQVTGLDTDGRIFVKSVGKVVGQENLNSFTD